MPRSDAREVLLLAVVLATTVAGPGTMLLFLLPPAALFIILYFVVRWVVAAGLRDVGGVPAGERRGRSWTPATPAARSGPKTTSGCGRASKPRSRRRV